MAVADVPKKRKASAPTTAASTKKVKKTETKVKTASKAEPPSKVSSKPVKKSVKIKEPPVQDVSTDLSRFDSASEAESGAESGAEDDQTAALLAGFSSDSDDEAEDNALAAVDGLQLPVPALPASAELDERIQAANSSKNKNEGSGEAGVVYVSRIPHGFYEHQMLGYFSQFGDITRLRLSRNRRTGASKHYAFIEFAHMEVARIVAETMNNYLMFGHSLKVRVVEPERVHPELFKGANKRFRRVPWNRIERARLAKTDRKGWEKRVGKEERRRADKKRLLSELGYSFESPDLRTTDSVPVKEAVVVETEQETPKTIDSKPAQEAVTVDELVGGAAAVAAEAAAEHEPVKVATSKKAKVAAAPTKTKTKKSTKLKA